MKIKSNKKITFSQTSQVNKDDKQQFCLVDKFTGIKVTLEAKSEKSKDDWLARLQREVEGNAFRKLSNPM